jgi:hypothetical protein
VAFGGRLLAENDRDEQRKLIKYNHRKPSVSRFDALQDVKPAHRRLTFLPHLTYIFIINSLKLKIEV